MYILKKTFFLLPIVLFICSCSNIHQVKTSTFTELNNNLTILNTRLRFQNDSLYKILQNKSQNENTAQVAIFWYPKATYFLYWTQEIHSYLDSSIYNLISDTVINKPDIMFEKLKSYTNKMLRIDPEIYQVINKKATVIMYYLDSAKLNKTEEFDLLFAKKSKAEQLFILNQTLHNIEVMENETLLFCNSKIN